MSRITAVTAVVLGILAGCHGGTAPAPRDPVAVAQEVREGCVAESLDLFQDVVDRLGPLAYVRSPEELEIRAAAVGCTYALTATGHTLACDASVRGGTMAVELRLQFTGGGLPVFDPAFADRLSVEVDAASASAFTEGRIELADDPERGLVIAGALSTTRFDGRTVDAAVVGVQGMLVADLPGQATGLVFTGGGMDFEVLQRGAPLATGTAALVGRVAVVALEVRGVYSQGEVALD